MGGGGRDEMGLAVESWEGGVAFYVKAHAGARKDGVLGVHDGMVRVGVTAAPEKGKANKAIGRVLAKMFGVGVGGVELLGGQTSVRKRFGVRGVGVDEFREAVVRALR